MRLNLKIPEEIIVWKYSKNVELKSISSFESKWEGEISKKYFHNYKQSRSYIRYSLSKIFKVSPLEVPLKSNPGESPKLPDEWGNLSLSHCKNSFIIAWAPYPIGIDIECKKRLFPAKSIFKKFLSETEKKSIKFNNDIKFRESVLQNWLIKESAFKWQKEQVSQDLLEWEWIKEFEYAFHKKKLKVKTYLIKNDDHFIGLAYNSKLDNS